MNPRRRSFVIHTFGSLAAAATSCQPHTAETIAPVTVVRDAAPDSVATGPDAAAPPDVTDTPDADASDANQGIFDALANSSTNADAGGGVRGNGYGGGGRMGALRGGGSAMPLVRAAPPTVNGLLSPEEVRRVVLRNLGQITHCHEQALALHANAMGRVVIAFVIGADGAVSTSSVSESTYPVASAAACMANAVRRWQFPRPQHGGSVTVHYPFNLSTET